MTTKYLNLFSPKKIGNLELKNRIVMLPMGIGIASHDGTASDAMIAFYEERAKAGVGLIITEVTRINDVHGVGEAHQLSVTRDDLIPEMQKLADAMHKYGTRIFFQLHHPGRQTYSNLIGGQPVVAPSAISCPVCQQETRALETDEVKSLVQDFIQGAKRAKAGGIDGVELHGAHGYLINQFLSPHTNKRTDEYGGSFDNRFRFIEEIIKGIRQECGSDFPLTARISVEEFLGEEGLRLGDGVEIAKKLDALGLDAINITSGTYETINTIIEPMSYPQGWRKYLTETIKKNVKMPVIGATVIRQPEFAELLIANGTFDFVGIARGLLADSEWTKKAYEARDEDITPCISCLHCFDTLLKSLDRGDVLECAVNARMARETRYPNFNVNGNGRKVAIIGGGPAGMETARVLAIRGFKPVIFEKNDSLGGQLLYADKTPDKEKIDWLINYYRVQLEKLDVDVHLGVTADAEKKIKGISPCAVFVATGSTPIIPKSIEGVSSSHVFTVPQVLSGDIKIANSNVAVIGSGNTGLETADFLAEQGNKVTVIEMLDTIGPDIYFQNIIDIMDKLQKHSVNLVAGSQLISIASDSITVKEVATGVVKTFLADIVVLSLGVKSQNDIVNELEAVLSAPVSAIGDARCTGRIANAVHTGFKAAYTLFS